MTSQLTRQEAKEAASRVGWAIVLLAVATVFVVALLTLAEPNICNAPADAGQTQNYYGGCP